MTFKRLTILLLFISSVAYGDVSGGVHNPSMYIEEQDASPSNVYWKLIFPDNTITDNGDNTASLNVATEAHLTSNYVPYTGAISAVDLNSQSLTTTGTLSAGAITGTTGTFTDSLTSGNFTVDVLNNFAKAEEIEVDGDINSRNLLTGTITATRSATNPATYIDSSGVMQLLVDVKDKERFTKKYHGLYDDTASSDALVNGSFGPSAVDFFGNVWGGWSDGLYKSTDCGKTFTIKDTVADAGTLTCRMVFVDSRNYIYWSQWGTQKIRRSIDGGETFADVCTFGGTDSGIWGITEDTCPTSSGLGYLYAGVYTGGVENTDEIWRSIDGGENWTKVYDGTDRHIHGVACDPYTGYVYATTGDTDHLTLRSIDNGSNWSTIYSANQLIAINFLDGMRLFGEDNNGRIYTTTDDSTFNLAYTPSQTLDVFSTIKYKDNIFFGEISNSANDNPMIIKTTDGVNYDIVWKSRYVADWSGPNFMSNVGPDGYFYTNIDHNITNNNMRFYADNLLSYDKKLLIEDASTNYLLTSIFNIDSNSDGVADNWTEAHDTTNAPTYSLVDVSSIFNVGTTVNSQRIQYTAVAGDTNKYIQLYQDVLSTFVAGDKAVISFYVKGDPILGEIRFKSNSWDIAWGNEGYAVKVLTPSSDWQRVEIPLTIPASSGYRLRVLLYIVGINTGDTIDIQFTAPQLEKNTNDSKATSFIPTTTTALTRNAETFLPDLNRGDLQLSGDLTVEHTTSTFDLTAAGTVTGEQVTSTDDADINDVATVGSLVTDTGGITLLAGQDIRPSANSTTALNIAQANGTDFVTFDTTNKRVGVNCNVAPSGIFSVGGASTDKAYFFYDNDDVGDATSGQSLYVYRRAAERDNYLRFYVDDVGNARIYGERDFTLTGQYNFVLESPQVLFRTGAGVNGWGAKIDSTMAQNVLFVADTGGNQLNLSNSNNSGIDHDHATTTDPTLFIHSDLNPDVSNNQWGSIAHNQENFVISTGVNVGTGTGATTDDNSITFAPRGTERARITGTGNLLVGTTDEDGTPTIGRAVVKGSTNDGSTNAQVWRDSDEANVASLNTNGSLVLSIGPNYAVDAGASDDYAVTITNCVLQAGTVVYFDANTANTGACTLNLNGGGAVALKSLHDQDPADNYIEAGSIVHCMYDGSVWQILSPDANP